MGIYIHNKYTNTYFRIVNKIKLQNRKRIRGLVYEEHHIIPKSCGGTDDHENLVLLTPKEHYICHRLLPKMCSNPEHKTKMIFALWCMINGNGRAKRHSISSRSYNTIRTELSSLRSESMKGDGNHFFGKNHTDEVKTLISLNNGSKREEVKERMRGPRDGFMPHNHYNGWSDEVKQKLREANLGKTHSEESKKKMSETRSNKIWIKKHGEKSKHIQKDQFESYQSSGWVRGR